MKRFGVISLIAFLVVNLFCHFSIYAAPVQKKNSSKTFKAPTPAYLVVNANTGTVLHQLNADKHLYPASLTKLMTIYLTFEAIAQGKITFDSKFPVSKFAASMPRSKLGLKVGDTIRVKELVLSLIVKSANDSAAVLAEGLAGSEANFARIMTQRAHQLGMRNTVFANASGWHHPAQKTTAYDMAKLAMALKRDYPQHYNLFSRTSFYYKNVYYKGHNRVTENLRGAEGMKTGYTSHAGFNLVTAAKRGDTRLIGVVMGYHSPKIRDAKMISLINDNFKRINQGDNKDMTGIEKPVKKKLSSKSKSIKRINAKARHTKKIRKRAA